MTKASRQAVSEGQLELITCLVNAPGAKNHQRRRLNVSDEELAGRIEGLRVLSEAGEEEGHDGISQIIHLDEVMYRGGYHLVKDIIGQHIDMNWMRITTLHEKWSRSHEAVEPYSTGELIEKIKEILVWEWPGSTLLGEDENTEIGNTFDKWIERRNETLKNRENEIQKKIAEVEAEGRKAKDEIDGLKSRLAGLKEREKKLHGRKLKKTGEVEKKIKKAEEAQARLEPRLTSLHHDLDFLKVGK